MKKQAKKMGRPRRAGEPANALVAIRLTVKERAALLKATKAAGLTVSDFIRDRALGQEHKEAGRQRKPPREWKTTADLRKAANEIYNDLTAGRITPRQSRSRSVPINAAIKELEKRSAEERKRKEGR